MTRSVFQPLFISVKDGDVVSDSLSVVKFRFNFLLRLFAIFILIGIIPLDY